MKSDFINIFWWKTLWHVITHYTTICGLHDQENPLLCARFALWWPTCFKTGNTWRNL